MRLLLLVMAALLPSPALAQPATVAVGFDRTSIRPLIAEGFGGDDLVVIGKDSVGSGSGS